MLAAIQPFWRSWISDWIPRPNKTAARWVARGGCLTQKRRGDFSFEISPPAFRFFEDLVRCPDHNDCHSGIVRSLRAELALPVPFRHSFRCKSFLGPSISSRFPGCYASPVSGSLRSSVPGSLAGSIPGPPDVPCLLSPTGEFLLR